VQSQAGDPTNPNNIDILNNIDIDALARFVSFC